MGATRTRWGILGAGEVAGRFCSDIVASSGSTVQAVGARDLARAQRFADDYGAVQAYGSYQGLVTDPDVDVVYVATWDVVHRDHALLALRAGKPVVVEKAFALNEAQAQEVVDEARRRDLFCMEAMWMRLHPLVRRVSELIREGAIGEVVGVHAQLTERNEFDANGRLFDPTTGGGVLFTMGVYPATFAWLLLGPPNTISASGSLSPTGTDLTVATQWGYSNGRFAQLLCSAETDGPAVDGPAALVYGSSGWLRLEGVLARPTRLTVHSRAGEATFEADLSGHGYGPEITEVEHCLREGLRESSLVALDDTVGLVGSLDEARRAVHGQCAMQKEELG